MRSGKKRRQKRGEGDGREKKRRGRAWSPLLHYKSTNSTGTVTD